jgi:hypothetical protein
MDLRQTDGGMKRRAASGRTGQAMRALAVALAVASSILALVTGCSSPSCEELCQEARSCPDSASSTDDCPSDCAGVSALNAVTDCADPYDDLLSCLESHGLCSSAPCESEQTDWFSCTRDGCARDPQAEPCSRPR